MKAISIRQPWADLIVFGPKRVENRTWVCGYRGSILIHASKSRICLGHCAAYAGMLENFPPMQFGALIGRADLMASFDPRSSRCPKGYEWVADDPWYKGEAALVFGGVEPLVNPVRCRGFLGIFDAPWNG